jgi:hypothetical protein
MIHERTQFCLSSTLLFLRRIPSLDAAFVNSHSNHSYTNTRLYIFSKHIPPYAYIESKVLCTESQILGSFCFLSWGTIMRPATKRLMNIPGCIPTSCNSCTCHIASIKLSYHNAFFNDKLEYMRSHFTLLLRLSQLPP